MDIIIFGGQSNMQGQSDTLTSAEIVCNAYEYKYLTDELVPLKNPVGEDITYDEKGGYPFMPETVQREWLHTHVTGSSCYGHTNLVPKFCRAYTELTGRDVVAVHIAKGSTVIADWLPGSKGYEILVKKASAAKQKVKSENVFFVWLQGESDAIVGTSKECYKNSISELCNALKRDIAIKKFGIIRVGRFTKDNRDLEIMSAQDEVCIENSDFLMLTDIAAALNEQAKYMNPFVSGHYSAKGLEKLGLEAGKALGLYAKNS